MAAAGPANAILPMAGVGDDQATFRLLMASLGNFLGDLDRARDPEPVPGACPGRPIATWYDADHLYLEGQFRFQTETGRDIDLRVLEGKFIIRLDRD